MDHQAWKDVDPARDVIADVAVCLLGTLSGTVQLDEKKLTTNGADYFFRRVVAARMTWARCVRQVLMVAGSTPAETRVLGTKHCIDAMATCAVGAAGGSDKGKERSDARPH